MTLSVITGILSKILSGGIAIETEILVGGPKFGPEGSGVMIATIGQINGAQKDRYASAQALDIADHARATLLGIECDDPAAGAVFHSIVAAFSDPDLQGRISTSYGYNYSIDLAMPWKGGMAPLVLVLSLEEVVEAFPQFNGSDIHPGRVLLFIISAWGRKEVNDAIGDLANELEKIKDIGQVDWLLQRDDYMVNGAAEWSRKLVFVVKICGYQTDIETMAE